MHMAAKQAQTWKVALSVRRTSCRRREEDAEEEEEEEEEEESLEPESVSVPTSSTRSSYLKAAAMASSEAMTATVEPRSSRRRPTLSVQRWPAMEPMKLQAAVPRDSHTAPVVDTAPVDVKRVDE